jgi:hypothetical protein
LTGGVRISALRRAGKPTWPQKGPPGSANQAASILFTSLTNSRK